MTNPRRAALALALTAFLPFESSAQPVAPSYSYADLADLAAAAPVAVDARIREAIRLTDARAAGVAAGKARVYVEADVTALIRGQAGLPARIAYVADVPLDARGRLPKLRKARVLLLARPVPGRPGELQLVASDAQLPWTAATDATVRAIVKDAVAADAPPRVTGIRQAFNVAGAIPGESETQIFPETSGGAPVSISVIRRPGEAPRTAIALGEIVDEAAGLPRPDTLTWYRFACGLPRALPPASLAGVDPARAEAAKADYALVLERLGPCGRTRG